MRLDTKGLHKEGHLKTGYMDDNSYSLSTWIENLGVVPLVLFAAFLLFPIFFNLFALLLRVTRVLETIALLLNNYFTSNSAKLSRLEFLSLTRLSVKVIFIFYGFLFIHNSQAIEIKDMEDSIILSIGEHRELKLPQILNFSIGNKDVISHRFTAKKGLFLIKGRKLGFSELVIWTKKEGKKTFKIYVIGKKQERKLLHLTESFKELDLITKLWGTKLKVIGKIDDIQTYHYFFKLYKKNKDYLFLKVDLSERIKNKILNDISLLLLNDFVDIFQCDFKNIELNCYYDSSFSPSQSLLRFIKQSWHVNIKKRRILNPKANLSLHLKIVQWEREDGNEINLGLDHLSTSIEDMLFGNISNIIGKNKISLNKYNISLSTLANPKIKIVIDEPHELSVGADIPYKSKDKKGNNIITNFKFAGLKINFKVKRKGSDYHLAYKTELSTPAGKDSLIVSGSKGKGSLFLLSNKVYKAFEISFKVKGEKTNTLPLLGEIPILGRLFTGQHNQKTYKKIMALIYLEEKNDS